MSQYPFEMHTLEPAPSRPASGSNGLGLTGFILSIVGLVTCGCFSPFGLLFSLIGVFRRPRGFAIAGLIISLLGLCVMGCIALLIGLGGFSILAAIGDGYDIAPKIEAYKQANNGAPPAAITDLPGVPPGGPTDMWGNPYHYRVLSDGRRVQLLGDGRDGQPGTRDDVYIIIDGDRVNAYMGKSPPWMK